MDSSYPEQAKGEYFTSHRNQEVVIFSFKSNLLRHTANLQKRDELIAHFESINKDDTVKVVVLSSDFRDSGCEAYKKFFFDASKSWDKNDVRRLCNITNQIIMTIVNSPKIFIHVSCGDVISLFMNMAMACDYSIVSDDTIFCNPYLDIGMLPKGGGPFFLSQRPCTGRVYDILLFSREIPAEQAVELGIADRVIQREQLEAETIRIARQFGAVPASTLTGMKRLVNWRFRHLKDYLEFENGEIYKIVDSPDFFK